MKPKAGCDYLATAAHFAAESSTGANVNVYTTESFLKHLQVDYNTPLRSDPSRLFLESPCERPQCTIMVPEIAETLGV